MFGQVWTAHSAYSDNICDEHNYIGLLSGRPCCASYLAPGRNIRALFAHTPPLPCFVLPRIHLHRCPGHHCQYTSLAPTCMNLQQAITLCESGSSCVAACISSAGGMMSTWWVHAGCCARLLGWCNQAVLPHCWARQLRQEQLRLRLTDRWKQLRLRRAC